MKTQPYTRLPAIRCKKKPKTKKRRRHHGASAFGSVGLLGSQYSSYQLKRGEVKETVQEKVAVEEKEKEQKSQKNDSQNIQINYNSQWKEIIRIMNTQKAVTTVSQNRYDEVMISHRCSDPTPKVEVIYRRMKYKPKPNIFRKFVVHKSEFQKMINVDIYLFPT